MEILLFILSLKESQYPELWLKFSHQLELNFNFIGMQPCLRLDVVYGAKNLVKRYYKTALNDFGPEQFG